MNKTFRLVTEDILENQKALRSIWKSAQAALTSQTRMIGERDLNFETTLVFPQSFPVAWEEGYVTSGPCHYEFIKFITCIKDNGTCKKEYNDLKKCFEEKEYH